MDPPKRRRKECSQQDTEVSQPVKFPHIVLFLLERKMGASRKSFLTQLARRKGFCVENKFCNTVTHVVSENNTGDEVWEWLEKQDSGNGNGNLSTLALLDMSWFVESMSANKPVDIQDRHRLKVKAACASLTPDYMVPVYACQRRTPLQHPNRLFTDALEILSENAEFFESEGRSLAFYKASSVMKALPIRLTSTVDLCGLPCIGEHSQRVIKEILEDGVSSEVEGVLQSERYQAMKVLTSIFGVGVKTADRWYREGIRNFGDILSSGQKLTKEQEAGVKYFKDLSSPVTEEEANSITDTVRKAVASIDTRAKVTITGGFRRGKQRGHDVDLLITHPEEGKEAGLLAQIITILDSQGLLLYYKTKENTYTAPREPPVKPHSTLDRFERCFSVFKLSLPPFRGSQEPVSLSTPLDKTCIATDWKAVRVDLVVSPCSQYAYALLGWTGSQHFERELRRFAGSEKQMALNSHALYDRKQNEFLSASTEEEIFAHLGLPFIPPHERNA
ncbi:DNA-directed DNA/RNA polymerase mu [Erpetoichthys calabaricus]|uniref:DNA-directed DNA/RNA polymerase mu n=1 Tax=Erpetoichthys calabaricus TaxID=27687 RepID=A0A8C4RBP5_ERPCA|nr:DNA-directed DNA/RNA polymerase mu [Erpetoichthys calabaricus]XP_028653669.1 DNA-directed DNA/RNA polymerase mu [Erpetoichthys calabaricus]XP_028653678.1 DNA-directed DNA/RNA polymerase mu [Erpetoichthys calabaricus]XP_028653694.1 DNA-directed DNA/RNA polymerase mu [Erpetoichthys calabaricus]XP_051774704.1 DNA-directed DNA/RNA polymerase mu [Erpetoichthys calabaricus]